MKSRFASVIGLVALIAWAPADPVSAQETKPNILVIWGDDVG